MKNFPAHLAARVEKASAAPASPEVARVCLAHLDLTSLNDTDTPQSIAAFAARAEQGEAGRVAALCVYPRFVAQVSPALAGTGIGLATVVNFPSGKGTPEGTRQAVRAAVADGADEIDIVLDHQAFRAGDTEGAAALLDACRTACGPGVVMKVILETAEFDDYEALAHACRFALAHGADFLKTSTGKSAQGGATLEAAAVMIEALAGTEGGGLKISGGVRSVAEAARYMALVEGMRGPGFIRKDAFRIGASSLLDEVLSVLGKALAAPVPASAY